MSFYDVSGTEEKNRLEFRKNLISYNLKGLNRHITIYLHCTYEAFKLSKPESISYDCMVAEKSNFEFV